MSKITQAAFALESVAHLRGLERELLPLAEHLRKVDEFLKRQSEVELFDSVTREAMKKARGQET